MVYAWKYESETPLQCLQRLQQSYQPFLDKKMSYAGRLDPMAYGVLPVLLGEENKNKENYLSVDKTYKASFLVGVTTDTCDVLGRHVAVKKNTLSKEELGTSRSSIKKVKKQTYPWFSSMTVDGIKLFDHFKAGNISIQRPERSVSVKSISEFTIKSMTTEDLLDTIVPKVKKLKGDFRQNEIIQDWRLLSKLGKEEWQVVSCVITVSTGTYIRALTELFPSPVVLFSLRRNSVEI
jgi:tRNA pseudouridine(55) synthase